MTFAPTTFFSRDRSFFGHSKFAAAKFSLTLAVLLLLTVISLPVYGQQVVLTGTISGRSGHETGGTVSIIRNSNGSYSLQLGKDFHHDNAPGPVLGFGNPSYQHDTNFADLQRNRGEQTYRIPPNINPLDYSHFFLWCKPFNVALGEAKLR